MSNQVTIDQEAAARIERRAALFNKFFEAISKKVEFKEKWNNGTGYYNGVCSDTDLAQELAPGQMATSVSPMPNNRKLILVGTRFGTVVVFERYTDGADAIYVGNAPHKAKVAVKFPRSNYSFDDLESILGFVQKEYVDEITKFNFYDNVGEQIEQIAKVFA